MGDSKSIHTSEKSRSGRTIFVRDRQRLGKYQILAELGRGGAASVSLAVARGKGGVHKLVVLKALLPELAEEPGAVKAFLDEARLAAQLNHPNVVQTYEVGTESGRHVIVMEYLDGQSLSRIIRTAQNAGTSVPPAIHLRVISEVLEGLHYAHEMKSYDGNPLQLVHRDISPQNVFVTYDGQVKLLDFGIAKAATTSTHTAAGIMKGKIAYMAPEQMAGTVVDRRADLYSVGCMLWAAATGQKLWHDMPDVQVVRAVIAGRIPSPKSVNPDCPDELERMVMRALQLDPDKRFATALEFQAELEQYTEKLGRTVKQRDIGKFASQLFADSRAELKEIIEQEVAALLLADEIDDSERESMLELTDKQTAISLPPTSDATVASGVQAAQPAKKNRWLPLALAFLGAIGIAAAWLGFSRFGDSRSIVPVSAGPSSAQAAATSTPSGPEPAANSEVALRVAVTPANARLSLDGRALEPGTSELKLKPGETHELVAEADGYRRASETFKVNAPTTIEFTLARLQEAKRQPGGKKVTAPAPAAVAAPTAPAVAAPKPPSASCENPFFVDAQGIKRVKPDCL